MLHGSKISQPTARVCHPRLRLGCQFTRAVDCPSFFHPRCVIYYFCSTAPESGNFVSRSSREVGPFWPEGRKPFFSTSATSKVGDYYKFRSGFGIIIWIVLDRLIRFSGAVEVK